MPEWLLPLVVLLLVCMTIYNTRKIAHLERRIAEVGLRARGLID
jgi:hypothetical protein